MNESSKKFFKRTTDYRILATYFNCHHSFTVEELYQAFKERLLNELKEEE